MSKKNSLNDSKQAKTISPGGPNLGGGKPGGGCVNPGGGTLYEGGGTFVFGRPSLTAGGGALKFGGGSNGLNLKFGFYNKKGLKNSFKKNTKAFYHNMNSR